MRRDASCDFVVFLEKLVFWFHLSHLVPEVVILGTKLILDLNECQQEVDALRFVVSLDENVFALQLLNRNLSM